MTHQTHLAAPVIGSTLGSARHYGMDWLRIGAFALLIFYHIGMGFVPWDWHVKWNETPDWVQYPMMATNGWRLALLFIVSGYASAAMLTKASIGSFFRSRCARLLIPLVFGIVVVVPVQPWIELMFKHGYEEGFAYFLTEDYFRFGALEGIVLPTWQHLWFVVYLFVYTAVLALLYAVLPTRVRAAITSGAAKLLTGPGILLIPMLYFGLRVFVLFPGHFDTHALVDDLPAHMSFFAAFLFGLLLFHAPSVWDAVRKYWKVSAIIAAVSYAGMIVFLARYGMTELSQAQTFQYGALRIVQAWTAIIALLGIADRFLNHNLPSRVMLTEAVFPFYIIHQTIIVVVLWYLLPTGVGTLTAFLIVLVVTLAGCWLFYRIGREIPGFRLLIGLRYWSNPARKARG